MQNSSETPPAEGEPSAEIPSELTTVIVLGSGFREDKPESEEESYRLTTEGRMRVLAAGMMYQQGLAERIIFSGGKTFGPDRPSEAEAMLEYLLVKFPEIDESAVILDEEPEDTSQSAENISQLIKKLQIKDAIVLTNANHLPRTRRLFQSYGINTIRGKEAEKVLRTRHRLYEKFLGNYLNSSLVAKQGIMERILGSLLYLDPKGKIPRLLTRGLLKQKRKQK
jgi:uncharacterized SAM-binding protein YcdF (DUF218 family)